MDAACKDAHMKISLEVHAQTNNVLQNIQLINVRILTHGGSVCAEAHRGRRSATPHIIALLHRGCLVTKERSQASQNHGSLASHASTLVYTLSYRWPFRVGVQPHLSPSNGITLSTINLLVQSSVAALGDRAAATGACASHRSKQLINVHVQAIRQAPV